MRVIGVILCILLLLAGCGDKSPVSEDPAEWLRQLPSAVWKLDVFIQGGLRGVLSDTEITIEFHLKDDASLRGRAACNFYGAPVTVNGSALDIGPIGSTEMLCTVPEGIMDQEKRYLTILKSVRSFQIRDNRLILYDASEKPALAFSPKQPGQ